MDPGSMLQRRAHTTGPEEPKAPAPPPAIPGAASQSGEAAPANKVPMDMSPNDALFDAINRGDIGAARDALNRGAELDSHNILGMTPTELSVDLGRNDISFLLLSYRGSDKPHGSLGATPAVAGKPAPAQTAAKKAPPAAKVAKAAVATPPAPQTPRLFANDGGTPVTSAGFLGFNENRSTP